MFYLLLISYFPTIINMKIDYMKKNYTRALESEM